MTLSEALSAYTQAVVDRTSGIPAAEAALVAAIQAIVSPAPTPAPAPTEPQP